MTTSDSDRLPPLDLSILASVEPKPAEDTAPETLGDIPAGFVIGDDEPSPPKQSRNGRGRGRSRVPPAQPKPKPAGPKTYVRDDEVIPQQYRPGIIVAPLRDMYVMLGVVITPFNQTVGTSLVQNAEACAKAWDKAARADKKLQRVLMLLIAGGTWGELAAAHMPIGMALAVSLSPRMREAVTRVDSTPGDDVANPVSRGM